MTMTPMMMTPLPNCDEDVRGGRKTITAAYVLYPPEPQKHQQLTTANLEIQNLDRSNTQIFPATIHMLKNVQLL